MHTTTDYGRMMSSFQNFTAKIITKTKAELAYLVEKTADQ